MGQTVRASCQGAGRIAAWQWGTSLSPRDSFVANLGPLPRERALAYRAPRAGRGTVPKVHRGHTGTPLSATHVAHKQVEADAPAEALTTGLPEPEPGLAQEVGSPEAYARSESAARAVPLEDLVVVPVDPVLARHNAAEGAAVVLAARAAITKTGLVVDWTAIENRRPPPVSPSSGPRPRPAPSRARSSDPRSNGVGRFAASCSRCWTARWRLSWFRRGIWTTS